MQNSEKLEPTASSNLTARESEWLYSLNGEIKKNISNDNFNIDDLFQIMGTSRTNLYANIKKITGLTLNQYIQSVRLEKAKELLEIGNFNFIHEIMDLSGFKNLKDFEKLYFNTYRESISVAFNKKWGQRLEAVVLENIAKTQYTVEDLIHDMSIGRRELYLRTKRITGLSPGRYIRSVRLKKAKGIIEDNKEINSVKEVAQSVGFRRTDYFSKLYEAQYNYRPLDYIKAK